MTETVEDKVLKAKVEHYRGVDLTGARFHNALAVAKTANDNKNWLMECLGCQSHYYLSITQIIRGKQCPGCKNHGDRQ